MMAKIFKNQERIINQNNYLIGMKYKIESELVLFRKKIRKKQKG